MIAMAIANDPEVLIADEPTTALDVTVQAQILEVIQRIQTELGTAIVFITHDLGVIARIADRVQVMYAGRVVERGDVHELFDHPRIPHQGLLAFAAGLGRERLTPIPGAPPNMLRRRRGARSGRAARTPRPAPGPARAAAVRRVETACVRVDELVTAEGSVTAVMGAERSSRWLEVTDLVKNFPVRHLEGVRAVKAAVQAVSGVSVRGRSRRDAGAGRGIGLGQVDRRTLRAAPDRADLGLDQVQGRRAHRARSQGDAGGAP